MSQADVMRPQGLHAAHPRVKGLATIRVLGQRSMSWTDALGIAAIVRLGVAVW
jgi:hypothetical protein